LIQLEEDGQFTFYEPDELRSLIAHAGFRVSASSLVFGDPPQAIVVSATAG